MATFFEGEKGVKCVVFVALAFPAVRNFVIRSKITKKQNPQLDSTKTIPRREDECVFEKPVTLLYIYIYIMQVYNLNHMKNQSYARSWGSRE